VTVAVAGAGTPVGAAALYRIAAGEMLGSDTPVALNVLGADAALIKDIEACGFPLLKSITAASSESAVMSGAAYALLLGGDFAALGKAALTGSLAAEVELASTAGVSLGAVSNVISWGDGIADISHATVGGKWALGKGGATSPLPSICEMSAGLQADAAVMHMRDWALGSDGAWVSMGVPAVGDYGMGSGLFFSVPVVCTPGEYKRIGGVTLTPEVASALESSRVALA